MSFPGQAGEHDERPASALPSSSSGGPQAQPYRTYGQDYQFTETLSNPPPELYIQEGEASTSPAAPVDGPVEDRRDHEIAGQHHHQNHLSRDSAKETAVESSEWVPPPDRPWYKRISKTWWIIIGISFIGVTGTIMAILSAMGKFGAGDAPDDPAPITSGPSASGSAIMSSSSTQTSSSQPKPTVSISPLPRPP